MAKVSVSPLLEAVMDKLGSGLWKELRLHRGVKKDIEKLQSTLSTIKNELEDAEQRSIIDRPLSNWLKKLKDAARDADGVMDEIQREALRRRMENRDHPLMGQVREFLSSHNHAFRHRIALKIKDLLERLGAIAEERRNFHLTQGFASLRIRHEETHSVAIPPRVYGRDEDKDMILNFLLNENNDEDLSGVAIIGLGGLGKTTLAQIVHNDERIKSSFNLRGWVCVSDEFDVRGITRKIIQSINKEVECDHLDLAPLGQLLRETLAGKRFILVLDDVWNEDREMWESLKSFLRCGNKGSKIVVTTRSERVASVMGSVLSHRLMGLPADDCWNLFRERAFGLGREKESPVLIEIGKKIVSKCGGLPLAAKTLGSLMGSKRGELEWLDIQNSDIWTLNGGSEILPALRLSYSHLSSYLKQCFVYCSLFPKGYVFEKEELISLWIGEGFVQSPNEGTKYFNSLSRRSFFDQLGQEYDYINRANKYKMHDLMHDLACRAANDEFRWNLFEDGGGRASARGSGGSGGGGGGRRRGSGGRGEGGDSGSNGNYKDSSDQPGGYNNNGSLFFNLEDYNNWRKNARRVKILLLASLLLEFRRKRSISPMENNLRGCRSETHQNIDLKIPVGGVSG